MPCKLQVRSFLYDDIDSGAYKNAEFKRVPGKSPVLIFYNVDKEGKRRVVDTVDLNSEHLTRKDLNELMVKKGFKRKRSNDL